MLFSSPSRHPRRSVQKPGQPRRRKARLSIDTLEDRALLSLSTITVNVVDDVQHVASSATIDQVNGNSQLKSHVSLRDAIIAASNTGPDSVINFALQDGTVLHVTSALPEIKGDGVTLDANIALELDGSQAGFVHGLVVSGDDCKIIGLNIGGFGDAGIMVNNGIGDLIESCQIGAHLNGSAAPNGVGVYLYNAADTVIDNSTVSNNFGIGIHVVHSGQVKIESTFEPGSSHVEKNGGDGILVDDMIPVLALPGANVFTTEIFGLVIDKNQGAGVHLKNTSYNRIGLPVAGGSNWIGSPYEPDAAKLVNNGNKGDGVLIESSPDDLSTNNLVAFNYIAGNGGNGVTLIGAGTWNTEVVRNRIGMTAGIVPDGKTADLEILGNKHDGVAVLGAANYNDIGGMGLYEPNDDFKGLAKGDGNIILANGGNGVRLSGPGATGNRIRGNLIGTDQGGKNAVSNGGDGVLIEQGASNNLVGGSGGTVIASGEGNLISGNKQAGVHLRDEGTSGNKIEGNILGTDVTGTSKLGNINGVFIELAASNNIVGGVPNGEEEALGNLISGNVNTGVALSGAGTTGNLVQANKIGTNLAGDGPVANSIGVLITNGASYNVVGGVSNGPSDLQSAGNLISGNRHDGVAIAANGTTNNWLEGNQIGTDATGFKALPNLENGVNITLGASGNFIGGGPAGTGNLISGNKWSGVVVDAASNLNFVVHNRIGTTTTALAALGNGGDGVDLLGSSNGVGWNVISGNLLNGVVVKGSQNVIVGNRIGTDAAGAVAISNLHDGVFINVQVGTGGNLVGAAVQDSGNLISGNGWNGIEVTGPTTFGNQIESNRIGTNLTGQSALPNTRNGIFVNDTSGYVIGGSDALAGNLISGNQWDGVLITGLRSTVTVLLGNRIGTNADGTAAVPNLSNGVHIDNGADSNVIGGTGPTDGNLISGNVLDGVLLGSNHRQGNKVLGNRIGTDVSGALALPNWQYGVEILQSGYNSIGGDTAGAGNVISGNNHGGVRIANSANYNLVAGNLIGTDLLGTKAVPNQGDGVAVLGGSHGNTIGGVAGSSSTPGNVISGNQGSGVVLTDAGTTDNRVQANFIGTTRSGDAPLGNKGDGVAVLNGATNNQIGGTQAGAGNVIARNVGNGVRMWGSATSNNGVQGNWIGTDKSGQVALGNGGHGVWIALGAHDNSVGGLAAGSGNVIAFNGKAGVAVGNFNMDATTLHNPILSNSIYDNGGLGIDLGTDGVTLNTPGGPHIGPNQFQNYPVIVDATASGATTTIKLGLSSASNAQFIIQVFASTTQDPTGYGEGKILVATKLVTTNGSGAVTVFPITVPLNLAGQFVTATATSLSGDTSEFSRNVKVTSAANAQGNIKDQSAALQPINTNPSPTTTIAPGQAERVGTKVTIGPVVEGPLVVQRPKRPTDAVFRTLLAIRDGLLVPTTPQRTPPVPPR